MVTLSDVMVVGKVTQSAVASDPNDLVRYGEMQQALSGVPAVGHTHVASEVTDFAKAVGTALGSLLVEGESVQLVRSGGAIGFDVKAAPSGGLVLTEAGLAADPAVVSEVGHTHHLSDVTDLEAIAETMALVVETSDSVEWLTPGGGPALAPSVRRKTSGGLGCDADGVFVEFGTGTNQAATGDHTHAELHPALTLAASDTLDLELDEQELSAEVKLAGASGLLARSGLTLDFGTGHDQAARGDHTHPSAGLTVANTATLALFAPGSGLLVLSGVVRCDPAPGSGKAKISSSSSAGLYLALGTSADTAAAGDHGHNAATTSASGFLSASDKTKLDGLQKEALVFEAPLVRSGNNIILPAASLTEAGYLTYNAPLVLAGTVLSIGYAQANGAPGIISGADKAKLDTLGTQQAAIANAATVTATTTANGYGFVSSAEMTNFLGNVNGAIAQLNRVLDALRSLYGVIAS